MNDMSTNDLRIMLNWYQSMVNSGVQPSDEDQSLFNDINEVYERKVESENMSFNECEGGACTL